MKRVIMLFSIFIWISSSYGQIAEVNQVNNNSVIGSVEVSVSQSGNHTAVVNQTNDKSSVKTDLANSIWAEIEQVGSSGNYVSVEQSETGFSNKLNVQEITTKQDGERNTVVQQQIMDGNVGKHQRFTANQTGDDNRIEQTASKGDTYFTAEQSGNNSVAIQNAIVGDGNKNIGTIKQADDNWARQDFNGMNARSGVIYQYGNFNTASQIFEGGAAGSINKNRGVIVQKGDYGEAYQKQNGYATFQYILQQDGTTSNVANQTSVGNNNTAYIYQWGDNAEAQMVQCGNNNFAGLEQSGDGSYADISQTGDFNVVQGIGDVNAFNDNGSSLIVVQSGNENVVNSMQTATGAMETVTQNGVGNVATVNQY